MNKEQAIQAFWSTFGTAYDSTTVPDEAEYPRITYEAMFDNFGHSVSTSASIWTRASGWTTAEGIKRQIENKITRGGYLLHYTDGAVWIRRGSPFAVRLGTETDDKVRRIMLNLEIEFIE